MWDFWNRLISDFGQKSPTEQIAWVVTVGAAVVGGLLFLIRGITRKRRSTPTAELTREGLLVRAIARVLIAHATNQTTLNYAALAAEAATSEPALGPVSIKDTFDPLHQISGGILNLMQSRRIWLPPITVLVVNNPPAGMPGNGFDQWAAAYTQARLTDAGRQQGLALLLQDRTAAIRQLQAETYAQARQLSSALKKLFGV